MSNLEFIKKLKTIKQKEKIESKTFLMVKFFNICVNKNDKYRSISNM